MSVDQDAIRQRLEQLAAEAHRGCGLSHDLYVERFSRAVDDEYAGAEPAVRDAALKLARRHDCASPEEIEQMHASQDEGGYCVHGLDANTCPAGCFE